MLCKYLLLTALNLNNISGEISFSTHKPNIRIGYIIRLDIQQAIPQITNLAYSNLKEFLLKYFILMDSIL